MASYAPFVDPTDAISDDEQSNSLVGFTRPITNPLSQPLGSEESGLHGSSDAESDSESDDSEDFYESSLQNTNANPNIVRNDFIPPDRANLYRVGGWPSSNILETGPSPLGSNTYQAESMSGVGRGGISYGQTKFATADRSDTSILIINSEDRDRKAYPQPTELQLHFPKVYRNVTEFSLTQLKLLSAFLYFREEKFNTVFDVLEQGRTTLSGDSNIIRVRMREGSYNINTLLQELTFQMNTPPLFFHFPNGFNDFAAIFSVNGDFAANFTLPGDFFFDSQTQKFIPNPTTEFIVTRFFASRFARQTTYTLNQLLVAYYYPVLKEILRDPFYAEDETSEEISIPGDFQNTFIRIINNFQGLNDTFVLAIIEANIPVLDAYRERHTFRNHLTNNYTWSFESYNNRVQVSSSNLNTSILADFQAQTNLFLSNALAADGITFAQFQAFITSSSRFNAILTSMYNYLQAELADNFAINFASYTIDQLASPTSQIFLQNGNSVGGVFNSYTPEYITAITNGTVKPLPDFDFVPAPPQIQWPNLSNLQQPPADIIIDGPCTIVNTNFASRQNIYNFTLSNIDPSINFTDANGIISADFKYGSAEIVTNISAGTYALFGFRSDVRQTLQVETLSRPFIYRYKDFNTTAFNGSIPFYFNKEYEFTYPDGISTSEGSVSITLSTIIYGSGRSVADAVTPSQTLNILSNAKFFELNAQIPPSSIYGTDAVGFDYTLNLELTSIQPFTSPVGVFIYHDKSGFMADARNLRAENDLNYLTNFFVSAPISTITVPITVLGGGEYYVSVRPEETSFTTQEFKLLAYWKDATSTPRKLLSNFDVVQPGVIGFSEQFGLAFADTVSSVNFFFYKTYNSNFIRLPIQEALFGQSPDDQQFNFFFPDAAPVIGYDDDGVSNDLTDYKGFVPGISSFVPGAQFAVDPLTKYVFNSNSPYNASKAIQSFFYSGSSNAILEPQVLTPYTPNFSNVTKRLYKIVHFWDPIFIGPQATDTPGYNLVGLPTLQTMQPYTSSTTGGQIGGFTYSNDADLGVETLRLGSGVVGINFVPSDGLWDIQKFTFKSAYMGSSDPNDEIAFIGIFDTNSVTNKNLSNINIFQANRVLVFSEKQEYTPDVVASNNGFDPSFGTWRRFETSIDISNDSFPYSRPDLVAQGLPGFTPYVCTIIGDERNFYTAIPFNSNFQVVNYFMLTGSAVPNPTASATTVVNSYFGFSNSNGAQLVEPVQIGALPNGSNLYQSQVNQSIPIGTSLLNFNSALPLIEDSIAIRDYSPFGGFVGDVAFTLRSANYTENGVPHLLFGDPTGARPSLVDVYLLRNPGGALEPVDTVFVNQFDLAAILGIPASQVITYGANTTEIFVMVRPGITPLVNIFRIQNLLGAVNSSLFITTTLSGPSIFPTGGVQYVAQFSTSVAKLMPTNNGDWIYTDDMTSSGNPNFRGFVQFNNNGTQTFFAQAYDKFGSERFVETTLNPNFRESYVLLNSNTTTQTVQVQSFSNSSAFAGNGFGDLYNIDLSNIVNGRLAIGETYAQSVFNIMGSSNANLYALSSQTPTRFQQFSLSPTGGFHFFNFIPISNVLLIASADVIPDFTATGNFGNATDNNGGIYFSYQRGNIFSPQPIEIVGNSQLGTDIHFGMKSATQIFYPTMKIEFTKRANKYNDITNLIDINYFDSNVAFNENFKTQSFFYSSFSNLLQDLGSPGNFKWGMESNFIRGDTEFQGFAFNSYIFNIGLQPSQLTISTSQTVSPTLVGDLCNYNWLAIRGYSPSENIATLVRFNLPNRHDYGLVTQLNLIGEISSSLSTTNLSNFNPSYVDSLVAFNSNFILTSNYGQGSLSNFAGSTIRTTGYSNWFVTFSTMYGQFLPIANEVAQIQSNVNSNLLNYISTFYGTILPSSIFLRTQITDSTPYELQFSTSVAPQLSNKEIFWGLGYNLGFDRSNLTGNTDYFAPTFFKILDDYIYLQLNDELNMNRLDKTSQENLALTLDGTGEVSKYNAKLLLANFGNFAQTLVQNTIRFNPPLPRLDRLIFRWIDIDGIIIDNNDCEWSAALQITEQRQLATAASSIPKL